MKIYVKPIVNDNTIKVGLPTVLAVGAISALAGAASVGVSKLMRSNITKPNEKSFKTITDWRLYEKKL